ncbi:MAG TPA: hypothetical protein ENK57_17555, partial [Polyangiaceae bacterium]|nr:hypothetical protein [Polyangiaceae bacterium]
MTSSTAKNRDHTAFIGAGLIGGSLAAAALERGERITVYNRTASKCEPLA